MSAQVNAYQNSHVGNLFARQNMPVAYSRQQAVEKINPDSSRSRMDTVILSPFAPKPLRADYVEEAIDTGKEVDSGKRLSTSQTDRLREDRVFTALTALAVMGDNGDTLPRSWPAGLPSPTREEMEEARRRLTQRLQDLESAENPEVVQQKRLLLLERANKQAASAFG